MWYGTTLGPTVRVFGIITKSQKSTKKAYTIKYKHDNIVSNVWSCIDRIGNIKINNKRRRKKNMQSNITLHIVEPGSTPVDPGTGTVAVPDTGLFSSGIGSTEATILGILAATIIAALAIYIYIYI